MQQLGIDRVSGLGLGFWGVWGYSVAMPGGDSRSDCFGASGFRV